MDAPRTPLLRPVGVILLAAVLAVPQSLQPQAAANPSSQAVGSYFVAYRTPAHVSRSGPEVFHGIADQILELLKSKHVVLVSDPERPSFQTAELFSLESLLKLAREAGASHLLYLTVDRPASKWVKITLQCFDFSGKLLCEAVTQDASAWSGKTGVQRALDKMKKQLAARLGGPGLAVVPPAPAPAPAAADKSEPQPKMRP